ncbi:MAG: Transposase, family [Actinomycetia bacterium]|jgi:hypothetical protein|nr:Transposase, family [Actinomycetes bacterium]
MTCHRFGTAAQQPDGPPWVSGALPGSVHDKKPEWIWGVLAELEAAGVVTLADKGYQGHHLGQDPLRCCPWRAGKLAKAIHVLQLREA